MKENIRVLVTGGAGFIGSHVADGLLASGHEVMIVDNLSTGTTANVPSAAAFVEADVCDRQAMLELFRAWRPNTVIHSAAQVSVRQSVADPVADAQTNIVGSLHVIEACREAGATRIVFASSGGAIYGEQDGFPAGEDHATRPMSPYGVGKLAVEHYLECLGTSYGIRSASLRYANVYGTRQSPHGEAGVVAIFSDALARGAKPTINGDGSQTRDYVFVGDVVAANLAVLQFDLVGPYNVGTGVETSVATLLEKLVAVSGVDIVPEFGPAKEGEQLRSSLCAEKLARDGGWHATTSLDYGLSITYRSLYTEELKG